VHHGLWDMDIPCAPMLVDITVNGQPVKALAQPTKQSILYVFNRVTGEPIWPIVETPVPKGDVPGEWYSPTQPIPTRPPAYGRNGFSVDDLIDFTPELKAQGLALISKYKIGPLFTPPVVSKAGGPLGTLDIGCCQGGTNWPGGSYDPQTHLLYVYGKTEMTSLGLAPPKPGKSDMNFIRGTAAYDIVQPPAAEGVAPAEGAAPAGGPCSSRLTEPLPRSIWTKARLSGRLPTARLPITFATTRRSKVSLFRAPDARETWEW